jgi:chemotaxis protein methyltransferase WspC
MIFVEFENLLKRTIGLDAASIGSSAIKRAVQVRTSACNLKDSKAYWEFLRTSKAELQELVEAVVIPETWFFRDREAFLAMARMAHEEWLPHHTRGVLRLLSLPCSTGEEPYSMAMALLDGRFPGDRFRVDAVDVSTRVLAHAKGGIYGKNSFRGKELGYRDRYFAQTEHGFHLTNTVRQQVRFKQGNLFDVGFLSDAGVYDLIFCRNMLIYFDGSTQERAVGLLTRLLTANGVLFVGPSETNLLLNYEFVPMDFRLAFAFHKAAGSHASKRGMERAAKRRCEAPRFVTRRSEVPQTPAAKSSPSPLPVSAPAEKLSIAEIRSMADQGQLAEAARRCEEYLLGGEPSAEALHLLGLIRDASGNLPEAANYYRKTLYLDPTHHQALIHLALLLEKQGDRGGAKVLNDRARRLDQRARRQHA